MIRVFTSKTQKIGEIGEKIAEKYLVGKGFKILDRNFTTRYGEIDLVAQGDDTVRFIEVKTIQGSVSGETGYRPEENVDHRKIGKMWRTIEIYMTGKVSYETWQIDVVSIVFDSVVKKARVNHIENVII